MKKVIFGALLLNCMVVANAGTISSVQLNERDGQYFLSFIGADTLPKPAVLKKAKLLILDFPETNTNFGKKTFNINQNGILSVDIVGGDEKTRAVIKFKDMDKTLKISKLDGNVVVKFSTQNTLSSPSLVTSKDLFNDVTFSQKTGNISKNVSSENILSTSNYTSSLAPEYKKISTSKSTFDFRLPKAVKNIGVKQIGSQLIITLNGLRLSQQDQKRLDYSGYRGILDFADILRVPEGAKIILNMRNANFKYSNYRDSDRYVIELQKQDQNPDKVMKQVEEIQGFSQSKKYQGQPLSLNFQDIEVRAVLQIIAEFTHTNIVVSDSVAGNITLRLDNVPWDQALDIILKTKGLGKRVSGNIIYIAPSEELNKSELDALKTVQEKNELVPSHTELFQIKYANAANLAKLIEQSRQGINGNNPGSFFKDSILSSKGTVSVDERTNTLLVSDIPSKLDAIRDLIAKLDEPVRQVLIDARLVMTTNDFTKDLGSKLGLTFFNSHGDRLISGSGSSKGASDYGIEVHNAAVKQAKSIAETGKPDYDAQIKYPSLSDRLGVNLGLASSAPGYGLAILGADFLVDLELSALQTEGKAEIISSPRVVTQDGQKATIASGTQIPYQSSDAKGNPKVIFKNAELNLDVTPRIAPDDRINMLLNISKNSANPALRSGNGDMGIDTNRLDTNVLVDNGETIVLGGIVEQSQSLSKSKVPVLGDIPVIGNMFSKTNHKNTKSELVIFVTPRIMGTKLSDYDKFSNLRR